MSFEKKKENDRFNVWNHWQSQFRPTEPPFTSLSTDEASMINCDNTGTLLYNTDLLEGSAVTQCDIQCNLGKNHLIFSIFPYETTRPCCPTFSHIAIQNFLHMVPREKSLSQVWIGRNDLNQASDAETGAPGGPIIVGYFF